MEKKLLKGPLVAVIFRSFASMIIDIVCALYLGVTGARSLKKYLQDKKAQIEAVRDVRGCVESGWRSLDKRVKQ